MDEDAHGRTSSNEAVEKLSHNLAPVVGILQYPLIEMWGGEMPDAALHTDRQGHKMYKDW
jgi:hypothetical protein